MNSTDAFQNRLYIPSQFKWWARLGYCARGAVYLVIGTLAVFAALGKGGEVTDSKGALLTILQQPFGTFLIAVLIVGLVGYSLWRLIQATLDPDGHGRSCKGLAVRVALVASAVSHLILAVWAFRRLLGNGEDSDANTEGLLSSALGQASVVCAGVIFVSIGAAHIYKGWTARFERYMDIPDHNQLWALPVCRFGLIARGVVWCLVGWFLGNAALTAREEEIKGMAGALSALQQSAHGVWLLLIAASGLVAFGLYSCLEARYRNIDTAACAASAPRESAS